VKTKTRYLAPMLAAATAMGAVLSLAPVALADAGVGGAIPVVPNPAPAPGPWELPTPGGNPLVPEGTHPGFYPSDGPAYGNSLAS
jgi:hypothetical protein